VASDGAWWFCFSFSPVIIYSFSEYVEIPIPPGDWHDYMLISDTMLTYDLYIDGLLARQGWFAHRFSTSLVIWGDGTEGAASTHHWDCFRFGVLVAPVTGDVNCDGAVNLGDINPFVEALSDPQGYQNAYPSCWPSNADVNGDGSVNFGDINPFVDLLMS
jgi:hypothetical protein